MFSLVEGTEYDAASPGFLTFPMLHSFCEESVTVRQQQVAPTSEAPNVVGGFSHELLLLMSVTQGK